MSNDFIKIEYNDADVQAAFQRCSPRDGDEPALGLNEALDYLDVAMNMGLLGKA